MTPARGGPKAFIDFTGKQIGRLTVLGVCPREPDQNGYLPAATWRCQCDCGKETVRTHAYLYQSKSASCGCGVRRAQDLTGMTFGQLTVEHRVEGDNKQGPVWACRCTCGGVKNVSTSSLTLGSTKSCGCLKWVADHSRPRSTFRRPFRQYPNVEKLVHA